MPRPFKLNYGRISWIASDQMAKEESSADGSQRSGSTESEVLVTNPSVVCEQFQWAHRFLNEDAGDSAERGTFAFYQSPAGKACIVKLTPIADVVLKLAENGIERATLVDLLTSFDSESDARSESAATTVIQQLESASLLVGHDNLGTLD